MTGAACRLAERIDEWRAEGARVIGLSGAQGSGKSTLACRLSAALEARGLSCCVLSLDDLYLSRSARRQLADRVHPLFLTRGVPGTHDVVLGKQLFTALTGGNQPVAIPRFIKAQDDLAPRTDWPIVQAPVDVLLFEGWCVGVPPADPSEDIAEPVNALEAEEDGEGVWRNYVEARLRGDYAEWFAGTDRLVYLEIPSFDSIYCWRAQQEQENAARVAGARPMDEAALRRFIAHYERLTRRAMRRLPATADAVVALDDGHRVVGIHAGSETWRYDGGEVREG